MLRTADKTLFIVVLTIFGLVVSVVVWSLAQPALYVTTSTAPATATISTAPVPASNTAAEIDFANFRARAEQGNAHAQWNLGLMYYNGEGVTQDNLQAKAWFRKAAEQGNTEARNLLAALDPAAAAAVAAEQGAQLAKTAAAVTAERETQREVRLTQAANEFEKDPDRLKNELIVVAHTLASGRLSEADAELKGMHERVHLLMDGRLKDTPAVEELQILLERQLSAATDSRAAYEKAQREYAERVARQGVTARNYPRLRDGMTYAEVVDILGSAGTELSSSDLGEISTVLYSWQGDSGLGANMNAMFQNDRLVMKAHFGLW